MTRKRRALPLYEPIPPPIAERYAYGLMLAVNALLDILESMTQTDEPTLADVMTAFYRLSEDTQRLHADNKSDRRAMESRIFGRLDDVLSRLGEYQERVDRRLDTVYSELDAFRTEATMRLQDLQAQIDEIKAGRSG